MQIIFHIINCFNQFNLLVSQAFKSFIMLLGYESETKYSKLIHLLIKQLIQ